MHGAKILVTGATGFIGRALVARLLRQGTATRQLQLLVRDPAGAVALGLPAESLCVGDLRAAALPIDPVASADLVFHVGAAIKGSQRALMATNAVGTGRLVALLRPGARLVHVSSLAAAGPSQHGETSGRSPEHCRPVSVYGESKRRGELAVQRGAGHASWIVIRPPMVYGPGDPATRLLFRQACAPMTVVPWRRRPLSLVYVEDLIDCLLLAAASAHRGVCIPVDGFERADTHALPVAIARACGVSTRLARVPLPVVWPVAAAFDCVAAVTGQPRLFSRDKLREIGAIGWVADPRPAQDLLGFAARTPLAAGLQAVAFAQRNASGGARDSARRGEN